MTDIHFDDYDVYYLANNLTVPELRRTIEAASIRASIRDAYEGTPYLLMCAGKATYPVDYYDFPFEELIDACHKAIKTIQDHNRKQPRIGYGGKRIDIEALKSRLDIVTEVERYTKLRKAGRNFTGLCPLHHDTSPSLTVYPGKQTWHCFGACNRGGDIIDFIMAAEGVDFKQAAAILGGT